MELFSEIYNCYYQVVARILEEAAHAPISQNEMTRVAQRYGYDESVLAIIPHMINGDWALLSPDDSGKNFTSRLYHSVRFPLTLLQKSWLKALLEDDRISLFFTDGQLELLRQQLEDITPLYDPSAFHYFDQFQDQDVITSSFRHHFQLILKAVDQHQTLKISYYSVKQRLIEFTYLPCWFEYSAKDGKFRLYALYRRRNGWRMDVLHIGRIVKVEETGYYIKEPVQMDRLNDDTLCQEPIVMEISDKRNALERTMLHFSSYQKKVERIDETGTYRCFIYYDKTRETELLIQVLAFGPVIRVLGPASFLKQVRERVNRQQIHAGNLS